MKTKIEVTEIDIDFYNPQLLYNTYGTIVLSSGKCNTNIVFTGTVLFISDTDPNHYGIGSVRESFRQGDFILFTGKLTLEND